MSELPDLDLTDPTLLSRDLVVSAGAGSGKTFTLSVLVAGALGRGPWRPQDLLATTFSEAAATDLRGRLLRPLDLLASRSEAWWAEALPRLRAGDREVFGDSKTASELRMAAGLWSEAPWMASPAEARAQWRRTRREAELLRVGTLHGLALELLRKAGLAPRRMVEAQDPALLRLLRREVRSHLEPLAGDWGLPLLGWAEGHWKGLSQALDQHRDALGILGPRECREAMDRFAVALEAFGAAMDPFLRGKVALGKNKVANTDALLALGPMPSTPERRLRWARRLLEATHSKGAPKKSYTEGFYEALALGSALAESFEAARAALLEGALARVQVAKEERGLATFGDLIRTAAEGLESGRIPRPAPALLLVDEVQDVSAAQEAFLGALGAAHVLRVGDLKQSIYGFRGGDPELLRVRLETLKAEGGALRLAANHRSRAPLVAVANALVEEVWPQVDPPSAPEDGAQRAVREGQGGVAAVIQDGDGNSGDLLMFADRIAALARGKGWDGAEEGPRRRALLLRARTALPRLRMELHRRGVEPYVLSREGFWESPGIRLLRAALAYAADPSAPLPRAVLLRQWLGMADGDLARRVATEGRIPDPAPLDATGLLARLPSLSTQEILGHLLAGPQVWSLLNATAAHGTQEPLRARRNLEAFAALALELPAAPASALAALDEMEAGPSKGDVPGEPEGADLIIQTVHASKGLEYEDVILPCLDPRPLRVDQGTVGTGSDGAFLQGWKFGPLPGPALEELKAQAGQRETRDELNLLYVALTRARDRMVLLAGGKATAVSGWNAWARELARRCGLGQPRSDAEAPLQGLSALGSRLSLSPECDDSCHPQPTQRRIKPEPRAQSLEPDQRILPPLPRPANTPAISVDPARQQRMAEGDLMHAYLRDLLLRWEDPAAFQARLHLPPPVPGAQTHALAALAALETQGWRHLPRRTELPLGTGRADLVIWEPDRARPARIHLVDFKHAAAFDTADLAVYRAQLARYAQTLQTQAPVTAWLLAVRSGELVEVLFR